MKPALLFLICVAIPAFAEDLRISTGQIYRNIQVYDAEDNAIYLGHGFDHRGIKLTWNYLTAEQRAKWEPIGRKKAETAAKVAQVTSKAIQGDFVVSQVAAAGVLGYIYVPDPQLIGKTKSSGLCFLYCNTRDIADHQKLPGLTLYRIGTFSYESVLGADMTVRAYTTKIEAAIKYLEQGTRDK